MLLQNASRYRTVKTRQEISSCFESATSTKLNTPKRGSPNLRKFRSCLKRGIPACSFLLLTVAVLAQVVPPELANGLKWRLIGPFRGGRVVAVAGVPGEPATFYFGSVGCGISQKTNAGFGWRP